MNKEQEKNFLGYNIYKLVHSLIVPKKPLNKFYIKETTFLDKNIRIEKGKSCDCYLVRAVFKINDQIIEGPSSQVICVK